MTTSSTAVWTVEADRRLRAYDVAAHAAVWETLDPVGLLDRLIHVGREEGRR